MTSKNTVDRFNTKQIVYGGSWEHSRKQQKKTVPFSSGVHGERVLCSNGTKDFGPRCRARDSAMGIVPFKNGSYPNPGGTTLELGVG